MENTKLERTLLPVCVLMRVCVCSLFALAQAQISVVHSTEQAREWAGCFFDYIRMCLMYCLHLVNIQP